MVSRLRIVAVTIGFCVFSLIGWKCYTYFFDIQAPKLVLTGIKDGAYYCGDIACSVISNKSGEISVWLDEQPLTRAFEGIRCNREYPFAIPSQTLSNGKHTLKIELSDKSYHQNKVTEKAVFYVDNIQLQAALVQSESDYKVLQGRTLHVQFQVNKEIESACVKALSNTYFCFPESAHSMIYECFIPISCEQVPNEYLLSIEVVDKVGSSLVLDNKFQVVLYPFKKDNTQVPAQKIQEEKEKGLNAHILGQVLQELSEQSIHEKLWHGSFCMPIDEPKITCEFGSVRTTQEKGRYMHKALDLVSPTRQVVWAVQDGKVVHIARYEHSGNTVIIDHGWGILSIYCHLDNFADITVGQPISKGNPVGKIGKTGHATGPHLHWEMRVNNMQIDPGQWTKQNF